MNISEQMNIQFGILEKRVVGSGRLKKSVEKTGFCEKWWGHRLGQCQWNKSGGDWCERFLGGKVNRTWWVVACRHWGRSQEYCRLSNLNHIDGDAITNIRTVVEEADLEKVT